MPPPSKTMPQPTSIHSTQIPKVIEDIHMTPIAPLRSSSFRYDTKFQNERIQTSPRYTKGTRRSVATLGRMSTMNNLHLLPL